MQQQQQPAFTNERNRPMRGGGGGGGATDGGGVGPLGCVRVIEQAAARGSGTDGGRSKLENGCVMMWEGVVSGV